MSRAQQKHRREQRYRKAVERNTRHLRSDDKRFHVADIEQIRIRIGVRRHDAGYDAIINERLARSADR